MESTLDIQHRRAQWRERARRSYWGIFSEQHERTLKRVALVVKLWGRGTVKEIAAYVGMRPGRVRSMARRLGLDVMLPGDQFSLWPAAEVRVEKRPARLQVVHVAASQSAPVQLALPFPELFNDQQVAA